MKHIAYYILPSGKCLSSREGGYTAAIQAKFIKKLKKTWTKQRKTKKKYKKRIKIAPKYNKTMLLVN